MICCCFLPVSQLNARLTFCSNCQYSYGGHWTNGISELPSLWHCFRPSKITSNLCKIMTRTLLPMYVLAVAIYFICQRCTLCKHVNHLVNALLIPNFAYSCDPHKVNHLIFTWWSVTDIIELLIISSEVTLILWFVSSLLCILLAWILE